MENIMHNNNRNNIKNTLSPFIRIYMFIIINESSQLLEERPSPILTA